MMATSLLHDKAVKTKNPQQKATAAKAAIVSPSNSSAAKQVKALAGDAKPIESAADIVSRRLRSLHQRLTKIEKNEELLAQEAAKEARDKHATPKRSGAAQAFQPLTLLNADQLKAIEKKETLLEVIRELEHLSEQITDWQSTRAEAKTPKEVKSAASLPASQGLSAKQLASEARQEMVLLWIALCRLDAVSTTLLSPQDFQALKTLYFIIHSLIIAQEPDAGLKELVDWMSSNALPEDSGPLTDLLPSYRIIKYCVGKILAASVNASKLPAGLTLNVKALLQADLTARHRESVALAPLAAPAQARPAETSAAPTAKLTKEQTEVHFVTEIPAPLLAPTAPPAAVTTTPVAPAASSLSVNASRSAVTATSAATTNAATSPFLSGAYAANPVSSFGSSVSSSAAFASYPGFLPSGSAFGLSSSGMYNNGGSQPAAAVPPPGSLYKAPAATAVSASAPAPTAPVTATQSFRFFDGTDSVVAMGSQNASAKPLYAPAMSIGSSSSSRSTQPAPAPSPTHIVATPAASAPTLLPSSSASWTFPTDSAILRAGPAFALVKGNAVHASQHSQATAVQASIPATQSIESMLQPTAELSLKEPETIRSTHGHQHSQRQLREQKESRPHENSEPHRGHGARGGHFSRRSRPTEASDALPGDMERHRQQGGFQGAWKSRGGPRALHSPTEEHASRQQTLDEGEMMQASRRKYHQKPAPFQSAKTPSLNASGRD